MDAYEYLFSKLQLKFEEQPDFNRYWWVTQVRLYFNSKLICSFSKNECVHTVKDIFLYLTDPKFSIEEWTMKIRPVVDLLRQFPRELESREHVDLLLTLNGMNKDEV